MHIVTDSGADFLPEQLGGSEMSMASLTLTIAGRTYRSGVDITSEEFYRLLRDTQSFAATSQPSPGDFSDIYRRLAESDREILSIHMSSGLSGTLNAARLGAAAVPKADVAFYDTRTLSAGLGWHVEMALRAMRAGWSRERILSMLEQVSSATETLFTLPTLRYLIHGGRISHLKGLLAQVLDIKPVIGVEKKGGTYVTRGQARTFGRALIRLVDIAADMVEKEAEIRAQIVHGYNPEGVAKLRAEVEKRFTVRWVGTTQIAPVLGAHTGPGVVGLIFAPEKALPFIP
ncbi:MAG: DegV family protein [Clostridia bacterium]|nr:DegV family protein [Clostridia bacterium]